MCVFISVCIAVYIAHCMRMSLRMCECVYRIIGVCTVDACGCTLAYVCMRMCLSCVGVHHICMWMDSCVCLRVCTRVCLSCVYVCVVYVYLYGYLHECACLWMCECLSCMRMCVHYIYMCMDTCMCVVVCACVCV